MSTESIVECPAPVVPCSRTPARRYGMRRGRNRALGSANNRSDQPADGPAEARSNQGTDATPSPHNPLAKNSQRPGILVHWPLGIEPSRVAEQFNDSEERGTVRALDP